MESLSMSSAAVPIYSYRRARSDSANSKKTAFFKTSTKKKKEKEEKKDKKDKKGKKKQQQQQQQPQKDGYRSSASSDQFVNAEHNPAQANLGDTAPAAVGVAVSQGNRSSTSSTIISLPPPLPEESILHHPVTVTATAIARLEPDRGSGSDSALPHRQPGNVDRQQRHFASAAVPPVPVRGSKPLVDLVGSASAKPEESTRTIPVVGAGDHHARAPNTHKGTGVVMDVSENLVNFGNGASSAMNLPAPGASAFNPNAIFQHIHEMTAKRVSTLDYLRKTHEGRVYWFNCLLFSRPDILRLPSFDPKKLAKRATNFLLLGLSLPSVLDLNTSNPVDYLRALNALLLEFETYQQVHPPDGANASSLSRARIPQMFKRSATAKGRRTSSATDIGLPMSTSDPSELKNMAGGSTPIATNSVLFAPNEQDLLPGEEYFHLLTPSLPFDPDFFEVFATLCDVLIDCYMRITSLVSSPAQCAPGVAELFAKADARLRKVIVAGIIKEFEDATRAGVKAEVAGIGKVVLGGLM